MTRREEIDKRLQEDALELLLKYAGEAVCEEMLEDIPDEPVQFSKRHEEQMQKLFKKVNRQRPMFYVKRIAAVLVVLAVLTGVSVMGVGAWRTRFFNFFTKPSQTNTEVRFVEEEETPVGDSYVSDTVTLHYIPAGMELTEHAQTEQIERLKFVKGEQFFQIRVTKVKYVTNLDTEHKDAEKVAINEQEGFYRAGETENALKWCSADYAYTLSGNLGRETLIQIAENVG